MNGFTDYDYHSSFGEPPSRRKEYHKNYYLLNKEIIKSQIRHNYNNNKERINRKVECECGRVICYRMLKKHLGTNLHKKRLLLLDHNKLKTFNTTIINNNVAEKKANDGWIYFE